MVHFYMHISVSKLDSAAPWARIGCVMIASSDSSVADLLSSSTSIARKWPHAHDDVCLIVHLIKVTLPSLAEVLSLGLIVLTSASKNTSELTLTLVVAELRGKAQTKDRNPVTDPSSHCTDVVCIDVVEVLADDRSAPEDAL